MYSVQPLCTAKLIAPRSMPPWKSKFTHFIDFYQFSHNSFLANYEENESRGWYCALLTATGIQYIFSIAGIVLLYMYYDCAISKFFITFNMILCVIVSVLSVLPQVQERISRSGLLQSSVVTLYVIFLTWSALSNNSDPECLPHGDSIASNSKVNMRIGRKMCIYLFFRHYPSFGVLFAIRRGLFDILWPLRHPKAIAHRLRQKDDKLNRIYFISDHIWQN